MGRFHLGAILACAGLLGSCSPAQLERAEDEASAPLDLSSQIISLAGEYRVAGIDGEPVEAPFGLALSVTEDRIIFDGPCGGYGWSYRLDGAALQVTSVSAPEPSCLKVARIHHLVFDLATAIDAAAGVARTPSNGIELSGGGRSVTLYSQ